MMMPYCYIQVSFIITTIQFCSYRIYSFLCNIASITQMI